MLIPPGPYRLELNGELFGRYPTLPGLKRAISYRLEHGDNPGLFQGYDFRGTLFCEHTGLEFRMITPPSPRPLPILRKPLPKLVKAS